MSALPLPRHDPARRLPEHELALVLTVDVVDRLVHLALEALDAHAHATELVLEAEHLLDTGVVEPQLVREALDHAQPLEIRLGVEAGVPGGALRPHEALLLVQAERLGVHADDVGGDGDHVAGPLVEHHRTFPSSSRSSRSRLFTRVGTWMRTRASTSPLPPPFVRVAPRPRMRSSFPSVDPAGTFSETAPSGVGTSSVAPSAACGNETGTSTRRSSPRRSYVSDASTLMTTSRSPFGPPLAPGSPLPFSRRRIPSRAPAGIFTE